ncbi:uncharacterized protein BROUX77_002333 [Berkeleyomyces rouxiae]|uniref:uncharacterized protein n=1 Tax=Berkeleyomyces rouxiae TaxID=2035830 RepID=UPI003B7938D3
MAFQTRASQRPVVASESQQREGFASTPSPTTRSRRGTQTPTQVSPASQTWVLFPPAAESEAHTVSSYLTINDSLKTRSEFGASIDHSDLHSQSAHGNHLDFEQEEDEEEEDDDDAELDVLDSHLADFRTLPNFTSPVSTTVLPAHDGLGSFRLPTNSTSRHLQEQLYAFEQFNPHNVHQNSMGTVHLNVHAPAALEIDPEDLEIAERHARIEAWRLEHSRVLLEEIQKETRRQRRISQASASRGKRPSVTAASVQSEAIEEESEVGTVAQDSEKMEWHDNASDDKTKENMHDEDDKPRGFLDRITKKVIKDMLDLDDHSLAIIFGEAYATDEDDAQATPRASSPVRGQSTADAASAKEDSSWQLRMVENVARELGIFVNNVTPHPHPGAFSTYKRVQQERIPYAGLEAIPESTPSTPKQSLSLLESLSQSALQFKPSFSLLQPTNSDTSKVAAHKTTQDSKKSQTKVEPDATVRQERFTQEEWEKDLDIKLVFRYLRSRFVPGPASSTASVGPSQKATTSPMDPAAKAARIRQQHPLIGGRVPVDRRAFKAVAPSSPGALRHGSTCSQSTRRSARRSSASSRYYWDIGGSIGTGSVVATATNGPMGAWGEV